MEGTRHVKLADILSTEALKEVDDLRKQNKLQAEHLKPVLAKYKEELLAKGVDSDYLAYAIEYTATKVARHGS